jgi:ribosome maturation factor RimP
LREWVARSPLLVIDESPQAGLRRVETQVASSGKKEIISRVEQATREVLAGRTDGLFLDRVEYERQGSEWFLRVFLDHPRAVTLDHCTEVARELGARLDADDPVGHSYNLEVSSPGVERPLTRDEDFERFRGSPVTLHLYRSVQGRKSVTGRLEGLSADGEVLVDIPPRGVTSFPRTEVASAHLAVDWARAGADLETDGGGGR